MALAACFCLSNVFALSEVLSDSTELYQISTYKFSDQLYVGVNGGVQAIVNGPNANKIGHNLSPTFNIYGGVDFNHVWGMRLQFGYTRQLAYVNFLSTFTDKTGYGDEYKINMLNAELNATFNLTNAIVGSKKADNIRFNVLPYVGAGWWHSMAKSTSSNDLYLAVGVMATYKVAKHWYITAEVADRLCNAAILGYYNGHPSYNFVSARLGVMYKFGDKYNKKRKVSIQPYLNTIETQKNDINRLNTDLAAKNTEIDRLQKDIDAKNSELERLLKEKGLAGIPELPIFFNLNSIVVNKRSKYVLKEYCDLLKKQGKDYKIQVIGYCDLATGTLSYNEKLKMERANKVASIITEEFGIPASKVEAVGGDLKKSPYADDKPMYSRVAIVKVVGK